MLRVVFGKQALFFAEALSMGLGMVQVIIAWAFGGLARCDFIFLHRKFRALLAVNA